MFFRATLCCCFLLASAGYAALSGQVTALAVLEPRSNILLGDQVRLRVEAKLPRGAKVKDIDIGVIPRNTPVEVLNHTKATITILPNGLLLEQSFTITSFEAGVYNLPALPITYQLDSFTQTLATNTLVLRVRTIPNVRDTTALQPIKSIWAEPRRWTDVLPYLAVGLMVAGLAWWWFRRKRPRHNAVVPVAPPRPVHAVVLEKLEQLEQRGDLERGAFYAYQSDLSLLLREYLEGRYQLPALELTTREIYWSMKSYDLPTEWHAPLLQVLQNADLIKFAKGELPLTQHREALTTVRKFVEETAITALPQNHS